MPLRRYGARLQAAGRSATNGRTYKEMVPMDSGDPDVEVEREVLRTSVMALDVRTGRFDATGHGGAADEQLKEERAA